MVNAVRRRYSSFLVTLTFVTILLLWTSLLPQHTSIQASWTYPSGYDPHGGYVDRLTFTVYPWEAPELAIFAIQHGQVFAFDESVSNNSIYDLSFNPAIEISLENGSSYQQFTLQCSRFPTNITGYRHALAYALDKFQVIERSKGGYAIPLDTAIPLGNPLYACESQLSEHFYTQNIAKANASLDAAHFIDTPDSPHPGWRYYDADMTGNWTLGDKRGDAAAPEGFAIEILVAARNSPAIEAALALAMGMEKAGLQGEVIEVDYSLIGWEFLATGEWNCGCFSWEILPPGEPWLLYDFFHSEGNTNAFFYRYNNSEYDYNASMMVNATSLLEARGWAWNCCRLLIEDMPMIVCYNDMANHAVRTDLWEGYVPMTGMGWIGNNPYTYQQIRLKEDAGGPFGCFPTEFVCVLTEGMDDTNAILSDSDYADRIFMNIYDRLWNVDPYTWDKVPNLAWNWTIEPTTAAGDIKDGMKYTFHLYENVTWHDGIRFTSEDVKYSLETIHLWSTDTRSDVRDIYRIDTPTDYTVEIYSTQPGYFGFSQATYPYI
ncbi:MAG: ABC transporter substrate-binding protein, partial [Promethearchaeota archaeon]